MDTDSANKTDNILSIKPSIFDESIDNMREKTDKSDNLLTLLDVKTLTTYEEFKLLRQKWNRLNDESPKGTVFASWEWLHTWWEIYKNDGNRKLFILCCYDHKQALVGIAPFQLIHNSKKYFPSSLQIVFIGTGETDGSQVFGEYMDLLIKPGYESAVINAFSQFLYENRSHWNGLKFQQLLENSHLSQLFKYQSSEVVKSVTPYGFRTVIDLPSSYKDYLMSLRKKMRNNITRTFSRLEAEQNFTLEHIDELENIEESIAILADLNRGRRNDLDQSSAFLVETFEDFHKLVAKQLLPLNKVRLSILKFGDLPVSALYSFLDRETLHVYQSGFEKVHGHRYSLLTTMLTQEISRSINDPQIKFFNFMFSESETTYKHRYSSKTEPMYNISYDKAGLKFMVYRFIHIRLKNLVKKLINK